MPDLRGAVMTKPVIGILLLVLLAGCAAKTAVWMEEGVIPAPYNAIEVAPVTNDTGETFDFDVAAKITERLKSRLKEKGYAVVEGTGAEGGGR